MTRAEAIERLRPTLIDSIDDWISENCNGDEWEALGYSGLDLTRLMAAAALTVLEAQADVNEYFQSQDMFKEL